MEANPDNFRNEKAYFKCDPGQILVRNVYSIKQQYTFDISIKILVKKFTNINYILHFVFRYQNGHLIIKDKWFDSSKNLMLKLLIKSWVSDVTISVQQERLTKLQFVKLQMMVQKWVWSYLRKKDNCTLWNYCNNLYTV
jgi:hypothetical protein